MSADTDGVSSVPVPGDNPTEATVSDQDFAADLASLRLGAGLSLRALVTSSGIPRSTLSDALAGRRTPRLETVLAIVRVCGADPDPWRRRWAVMTRQQRLLDGASALGGPAPGPAQLAQLPRDVAGFASREHELARLERGGIALIHGRPGVGKSALAVHWAHSVSARYPDGQLFLNVRGHHPTLGPMSPVEAMGRLLGSLGVPWAPNTRDPDEGAGLWRSSLAGRRLLIVLDDAISADQVRPLLPGAPGCAMVVTSRHYLADLIVREGVESIVLDVLPSESSVALLGHVAGAARVEAEPAAAAAVAMACGHLPLALRLAGAVLAGAPDRSFAELVDELATGDRLTALEGLTRPSAVEDAFELSYRVLPEDARFLFRRLGLHPGPDFNVRIAALLGDLDPDTTDGLLRTLAEAHLVEPGRSGRYRMHDLLCDYAARLVDESDGVPAREAARRRLLDWYVHRALAVSARLDKGRERLWVDAELRSSWEPGDEEAAAWLEAEHRNVIAAIEYDARHGTGRYAWALVDLIAGVLLRRRNVSGLIAATDAGLAAARRHGDQHAEGTMYLWRGWLRWRGGQGVDDAAADFDRARTLFHAAGVRRAEAAALRGLSTSHGDAGRPDEAREYAEAALEIYRAEGDRSGEARVLNNLAVVTSHAARFAASAAYLDASLALHRETGSRSYSALVLANLAHVCLIRGAITRAIACTEEAVALAREIGDGASETVGLINGALAYEQAGLPEEAHRWATAALAQALHVGYQYSEAVALDALATTSRRLGHADARSYRSRAIRRAQEASDLVAEAEILVGAARDEYQNAVGSSSPDHHAFRAAYDVAQRALDAGLAGESPHVQAEALGLLAACHLGLGKVADALAEARQAVEMHVASGARLAEITARCILALALFQDADPAGADLERRVARDVLEELAVPDAAPVRRLLDSSTDSLFPPFA
jgi:tetratricopeptide (TPR) repeat protein/transcriptional regulator with XRE-family HTH domain